MTDECNISISAEQYDQLLSHLFPGDGDEHGAVLHAGVVEEGSHLRLVVREVIPAKDSKDYVAGKIGYRALDPSFIHRQITHCRDHRLAYLAVHNHDCDDRVGFSRIDMASHERGYPALSDIGKGIPVGALVLGRRSMEADVWLSTGRRLRLRECRVIGETLRRIYPRPLAHAHTDPKFDRQIRMFGASGQSLLRRARVAVIGLGGVGSLVCEYMARLGVGEIIAVDPDHIESSNLSRVVGATQDDVLRGASKTAIAARHAAEVGGETVVQRIDDDVAKCSVAGQLRNCDYLFLAADSMRARLVTNALVHQYLIPGVQLGAKIRADERGALVDVMAAVRPLRPGSGCLWCNQLINPHQLAVEAKSDDDRLAQAYGVAEPNPSVVTLNAVSAAHAVNDFLLYYLGLNRAAGAPLHYSHFHFLDASIKKVLPRKDAECRECGSEGRYGKGDAAPLPCLEG